MNSQLAMYHADLPVAVPRPTERAAGARLWVLVGVVAACCRDALRWGVGGHPGRGCVCLGQAVGDDVAVGGSAAAAAVGADDVAGADEDHAAGDRRAGDARSCVELG